MNDNLVGMNMAKIDEIRNQLPIKDWSAQPVENATIDDLDDCLPTHLFFISSIHSLNP